MHTRSYGLVALFFWVAALCLALVAGPAAGADERLLRLQEQAQTNGSVRVLVTLRAPDAMEAYLPPAKVAEHRQAVATVRNNVLDDLLTGSSLRRDDVKRSYRVSPVLALEATPDVLEALMNDPRVERVAEDQLRRIHLEESTQLIGADGGWPAFSGGNGQAVAVFDTGVDYGHPALADRVVAEACFSTNGSATDYTLTSLCPGQLVSSTTAGAGLNCDAGTWGSGCAHGTHVAGIVASTGAGAPELQGVAPQASIIAMQVFTGLTDLTAGRLICGADTCPIAFDSDLLAGLEHVFMLRDSYNIAAINMSLGGGDFNALCDDSTLKPMIDQLREAGIATVISSGNDGWDGSTGSPGCISTAVTVGSSTKGDNLSGFSNTAPWVDLIAPGSSICSTVTDGFPSNCGTDFGIAGGTSMAAPHVAGAFAVLRALSPTATVTELESHLKATGAPVATYLGNLPRIQLDDAVATAVNDATKPPLINVATRAFVGSGADVLIGGFIIGDGGATVVVRARGPSLADVGVPGALTDPTLTVFDGPTPIASNDDWQTDPNFALVQESGMEPPYAEESALLLNLDPGEYTVIVSGVGGETGVGIVEAFELTFATLPTP